MDKETGYGGIRRPHRSSPSDDLLDALRNKNLAWSQMNNAKEISIYANNEQKRRQLPDGSEHGVKIDFCLKRNDSSSWDLAMYLYNVSQKFKEWSMFLMTTLPIQAMLVQLLDSEWKRKVSQLLAKYVEQMQEMAETLDKFCSVF
ncbi:hypothetical protein RFI_35147 [Reticulomyxa filosa]|uniref:Uncharacterized protein n=1 Tax=Reticulomyxa filosa TaxID=46433 RepID=X6LKZ0_RETFI|nr:hypothetical protein RFI_35147 [Reticulomyxa filosa]|eukprot:ETO02289.1 hypothetical protein RFI_35147 [Reticulomyxa filosa]